MTISEMSRTIRATVHRDAINSVPSFFNATTEDVLGELLQNARRAGATKVRIETGEGVVTVNDDGEGIADPATLLAFGQSMWEGEKVTGEHPAGMGMYSLARNPNVQVSSKRQEGLPWTVSLTPRNFSGEELATVEIIDDADTPVGTSVSFHTVHTRNMGYGIKMMVERAARHYPLEVELDGLSVKQQDFLHDCQYIEEWEGCRIGVMEGYTDRELNFHGMTIVDVRLPIVSDLRRGHQAKVDVVNCPGIELTLPSRKGVVETPFMGRLRQECKATIYRSLLNGAHPVNVSYGTQQDAAKLGVMLPDAEAKLVPWQADKAEPHRNRRAPAERLPFQPMVMMNHGDLYPADEQALQRALGMNGMLGSVVERDNRMMGYRWYDALVKVEKLEITIENGDRTLNLEQWRNTRDKRRAELPERPDAIRFTLHLSNGESMVVPGDVAFGNSEDLDIEVCDPMVTKESRITVEELRKLMMDGLFAASCDEDSFETQESNAKDEARRQATSLLFSEEDALRETIEQALRRHVLYELPDGWEIRINMKRGEPQVRSEVKLEIVRPGEQAGNGG